MDFLLYLIQKHTTMSTKLYTGIKFNSNRLGTVIRQLHDLKEEAVANVMETFRKGPKSFNFTYLLELYDKAVESGLKIDTPWSLEWILRKELGKPHNEFWFEFGVTIFERKNKLYGIYFDQTRKNHHLLFDRGIAVDYHYQDQTDKPDDISWKDWNFRETVWSDIFDDISVLWKPSEAGAVYNIVGADDIVVTNEMMDEIVEVYKELKEGKEKEDVL